MVLPGLRKILGMQDKQSSHTTTGLLGMPQEEVKGQMAKFHSCGLSITEDKYTDTANLNAPRSDPMQLGIITLMDIKDLIHA